HVNSQWFNAATGNFKLVILITQDSIIAPQLNYDADPEFIPDYVHMHMLRGTVTGATGLIAATNPTAGFSATNSYTIDWNPSWDADHCEIIAFITNGDDGEVLNVVKQKLVE
ncbi:MAG: Omp28-related outer membrane protein, partial [Flavobacteriales bacterium]